VGGGNIAKCLLMTRAELPLYLHDGDRVEFFILVLGNKLTPE
jgi:hypothetical protein